jgi:dTDP-4-dehydrorhamnose reductase
MNVLITGANGQLGYDVIKRLSDLGIEHQGIDIQDCDITDRKQTMTVINSRRPDCVVHCAAYTAVDKAETDRSVCHAVNVEGTRNVALACKASGAIMIYISTDYVFNGKGTDPFMIHDPKAPLNVYGKSKLEGELAVQELLEKYFIVRTSWVFGLNGPNFVKTMLRLGKEKERVDVVRDQIGSPTYSADLAVLLCDMMQTKRYGIYHATNEGYCSWFDFAESIMKRAGLKCLVSPVLSADYPTAAKRPMNSRLSKRSLSDAGFALLPAWEDALKRYLAELEAAAR